MNCSGRPHSFNVIFGETPFGNNCLLSPAATFKGVDKRVSTSPVPACPLAFIDSANEEAKSAAEEVAALPVNPPDDHETTELLFIIDDAIDCVALNNVCPFANSLAIAELMRVAVDVGLSPNVAYIDDACEASFVKYE